MKILIYDTGKVYVYEYPDNEIPEWVLRAIPQLDYKGIR